MKVQTYEVATMLKNLLFLAVLLLTSSCSNMNMGNLFGQNQPKKDKNYYTSDEYYLEDDEDAGHEEMIREDQRRVKREPSQRMRPREERYIEVEEERYEEDEYNYRPQRDRCTFYGLKPGTASYRDCKRQLSQQRSRASYDR